MGLSLGEADHTDLTANGLADLGLDSETDNKDELLDILMYFTSIYQEVHLYCQFHCQDLNQLNLNHLIVNVDTFIT